MKTQSNKPNELSFDSRVFHRMMKMVRRMPVMPSSDRYNVTICNEYRFVWFRVAKVCTRTILAHLEDSNVSLDAEHAMSIHYPINQYADYFKFVFVRNPWDRLVSCWLNKIIEPEPSSVSKVVRWRKLSENQNKQLHEFGNFVDFVSEMDIESCDIHLRQQSSLIDLVNIDFLGRFETFDSDYSQVMQHINLPVPGVKKVNQSRERKPYRDYYNDRLVDAVAEIYKRDIQIFGYRF